MIWLDKTSAPQKFAITCSELGNLIAPFYLFIFKNMATNDVQSLVLNDLSQFEERYNLFEMPGDFFTASGWYLYKVFEQDNGENLAPGNGNLVESGRLYVSGGNTLNLKEYSKNEQYTEYNG